MGDPRAIPVGLALLTMLFASARLAWIAHRAERLRGEIHDEVVRLRRHCDYFRAYVRRVNQGGAGNPNAVPVATSVLPTRGKVDREGGPDIYLCGRVWTIDSEGWLFLRGNFEAVDAYVLALKAERDGKKTNEAGRPADA